MSKERPWLNLELIDIDIHKAFVYRITNIDTQEKYIGKKNLFKYIRKYKTLANGTKSKRKTKHISESNWREYNSSSDIVKEWTNTKREILYACHHEGEATYKEIQLLWKYDVLNPNNDYVNRAIGNFRRWYK